MITGHRLLESCPPVGLTVESDFDVDTVRRLAAAAAAAQGFDRTHAERASFVAAEMAANLARQGRAGRILVRLVEQGDLPGVDLVASDGPEAGNAEGAPDERLAAAARVCDMFDMYGGGRPRNGAGHIHRALQGTRGAAMMMRDAPRADDDALVLTLRGTDGADAAARAIVREAG